MAATPEASLSQNTLIAQNWNSMPRSSATACSWINNADRPGADLHGNRLRGKDRDEPRGARPILQFAGHSADKTGHSFPRLLCHQILDSSSIGEAISVLMTSESGASGNFLVAHAEGEAVDIEKTPTGTDYLYGSTGVFWPAPNHFESRLVVEDEGRKLLPDSVFSAIAARVSLGRYSRPGQISTLQAILRDHVNRPETDLPAR